MRKNQQNSRNLPHEICVAGNKRKRRTGWQECPIAFLPAFAQNYAPGSHTWKGAGRLVDTSESTTEIERLQRS